MQLMNRNNNTNLLSKLPGFIQQLNATGKTPETILNELLSSGKVTKEQVEQATNLAKLAQSFIK